jgi:alanine-glyoxylate transaminase/serine-glyoxylate transaminase/serine-pyruvate transaminase
MTVPVGDFHPSPRILLGPGPSMVNSRVLQAMATPLLGHLDPEFLAVMDEIQVMLRRLFRTTNRFTIAVSGTGSAGMEAALVNLIEPGDTVVVGVNGVFGTRMASVIERCGGKAIRVEAPWGRIVEPEKIRETVARAGPLKAVALVHAETSTGVLQPLAEIGALCREQNALFVVDAVTSLGGVPVDVDGWRIDACYSGTQKCLSCPPGLAPLTLSDRALTAIRNRKTPCQSWYLDMSLLADYWTESKRAYHHTAPISMLYALREALRLVEEEGLERRFARHARVSAALLAGLAPLGLSPFPQQADRLPTLNCIGLPDGLDEAAIRSALLQECGIEIGGGLGPLQGKVWRIGLMGESATLSHVLSLLQALEQQFMKRGRLASAGLSLAAAARAYASSPAQAGDD